MRSSDQRYHQVQRPKRDRREWESISRDLVLVLRDVRTGQGEFAAVEDACRRGAPEYSHILLACGRTNTDFRRNYRVGSPNWHTVFANDICPVEVSRAEQLDGFAIMRLSKEQTKNVKLRWTKLTPRDVLIHDPQGALWAEALGCWIDGQREEHLGFLTSLRERGVSLVAKNADRDSELALERAAKEFTRFVGQLGETTPEWFTWDGAGAAKEVSMARTQLKLRLREGAEFYRVSEAEHRLEIEKALVVVEAHRAGGDVRRAVFSPDTSQRHCSAARLRERIDCALAL